MKLRAIRPGVQIAKARVWARLVSFSVHNGFIYALLAVTGLSLTAPLLPRASAVTRITTIAEGCITPPSGMAAWWPGDTDASDIVGDNDGTLLGGATSTPGKVGNAFGLDGATAYVRVPTSDSLNPTGSFTLDAWIFPTADEQGAIVRKWGDQGDYANQRAYALLLVPGGRLVFGISDDAHQTDAAFHGFVSPDNSVTVNAWNFVTAVYDQTTGTRRIFVNGVQVAERTDEPITLTDSAADLSLGAHQTTSTTAVEFFTGLIDEVELFNRALSESEIQAIYNSGSAGKCKDSEPGDTQPPSVTINQAATQADPTSVAPILFTVVFSEPVTGFDSSDIVLGGTAGATTAIVTGSGAFYQVSVSGMTQSGTVSASIPADAAIDAATNPNTASTSTDNTVAFNAPGPPPDGLAAIEELKALVMSLNLHRGITQSLKAKLNAATQALHAGDVGTACDALQAFLNEVRAQTDKKISSAQAAELNADANAIRTLLGCP